MTRSWLLFCMGIFLTELQAQVKVEYIAHASFILESSRGTRVAIDPYNGEHSLGYYYPDGLEADAVAVTHPHFDHDASYYFGSAPVFSEEGSFRINDVNIRGIKAAHAGAERFKKRGATPHNTIFKIEIDGIKILHLGDNGLLDDEILSTLGETDVLLIQIFEDHHFYNDEEFDRLVAALQPSLVIPMHYRLTAISEIPRWTGDVSPWLISRNGEKYHSHEIIVNKDLVKSEELRIVQLKHSPEVRPWKPAMKKSWEEFSSVRSSLFKGEESFEHLNERMTIVLKQSPEVLIYYNLKAQLMDSLGEEQSIIHLLEEGLTHSGMDDWEQQIIARGKLARLYLAKGLNDLAAEQYRWIATRKRTYQQAILEEALQYLYGR